MAPSDLDKLMLEENDPLRKTVRLLNPLGEEYSLMRTTLIPALLRNIATNQSRKTGDIRLYELNRVFIPKDLELTELPEEPERLALALSDSRDDFFSLKGMVEEICRILGVKRLDIVPGAPVYYHPGRSATLMVAGQKAGDLGELHPDVAEMWGLTGKVYIAELDLAYLEAHTSKDVSVKPLPKYPAVTRDLSVSVSAEQNIGPMLKAAERAGGALVEQVELFDVYEGVQAGEGRKSVAIKITMRSNERTLVEEDANKCFNNIVEALNKKFGAIMRQ